MENIKKDIEKLHLEEDESWKKTGVKNLSLKQLHGIVSDVKKIVDLFEIWTSECGKSFKDDEKDWRFWAFKFNLKKMVHDAPDLLIQYLRNATDLTDGIYIRFLNSYVNTLDAEKFEKEIKRQMEAEENAVSDEEDEWMVTGEEDEWMMTDTETDTDTDSY